MTKTRILIADDEPGILRLLRTTLEGQGFSVVAAVNGVEAIAEAEKGLPDLVILDIMMPKMDGFAVCQRLREWSQVPIIVLSARADESDKVKCLELGADDYITKPFGAAELIARVHAVLRRYSAKENVAEVPSFDADQLHVNFANRQVTLDGSEVKLTPTEFNLLRELVMNRGKALTHAHLLNKVWGAEYCDETEYLHVFIRRLRVKLERDANGPQHIMTLPGVGYQFREAA